MIFKKNTLLINQFKIYFNDHLTKGYFTVLILLIIQQIAEIINFYTKFIINY